MLFRSSGNMSEKDCDIVLTYTGTTEKTIEIMNHLYSHHVPVILIVGMGEQTIRKMSDVVLTLTTREHLSSNIGSFTSSVSASPFWICCMHAISEVNMRRQWKEELHIHMSMRKTESLHQH